MSELKKIFLDAGESDPRQKIVYTRSHRATSIIVENLTLIKPDDKISTLENSPVLLENATAEFRPGNRVALMGHSGCGKSTLLNCINNAWPWGNGNVTVPAKLNVLFLPQTPYIASFSFRNVLTYPKSGNGWSDKELESVLRQTGLESRIPLLYEDINGERLQRTLSGGEKQRLRIATVLLHKPDILMLDEVTASLDEKSRLDLYQLITDLIPKETILISVIHQAELLGFHTHLGEIKDKSLKISPVTPEMLKDRKKCPDHSCPPDCSYFRP